MTTAPVEGKVWGSLTGFGTGSVATGLLLWLFGVLLWGQPGDAIHAGQAVAAVPSPVALFVGAVVAGGGTFLGGWLAKHTPRPADRPVIVKSDATTATIDSPVVKAVADDLRRQLIEGRQMTEAVPDTTPET